MSLFTQAVASSNPYTFVLWGQKFDGETASIFITQFRRIGAKVKVIGINGPMAEDHHGLVLHADMVLGDAAHLAEEASCVILPCGTSAAKRLQEDPRVMTFLSKTVGNGAILLVRSPEIIDTTALAVLGIPEHQISFYERSRRLRTYATEVATELLSAIEVA